MSTPGEVPGWGPIPAEVARTMVIAPCTAQWCLAITIPPSNTGADYIMTIKATQPGLLTTAQAALSGPAAEFTEYTELTPGHGRTDERIVRTTTASAATQIEFPHTTQLFRVIHYTGDLDGQRHSKEVAYYVSSLTPDKAGAHDLGQLLREHWSAIENKLRNTLIAAFRLTGWRNLTQARRYFPYAIHQCVDLIIKPVETVRYQTYSNVALSLKPPI